MSDETTEPTADAAPEEKAPAKKPAAKKPAAKKPAAKKAPAKAKDTEVATEAVTEEAAPAEAAPEAPAEVAAPADPVSALEVEEAPDAEDILISVEAAEATRIAEEISADELAAQAEAKKLVDKPGKDARYQSTGKRKTSVARVILTPGDGTFWINGRTLEDYFPRHGLRTAIMEPLITSGATTTFSIRARIHGGGVSSQAGALRHGISRALADIHPIVRTQLKSKGFLKLDARQVERKKAGLKKARKRPQFSKR